MEQKIQLKHPAGKKAVSMDKEKYNVIEKSVLNYLQAKGESTHTEILMAVTEDFKNNNTLFKGSVEWHLEWVKLDLEARKVISRISDTSPIKFKLV
ncbi:MAG: hypothetical protein HOO86_12680 [Bacteroidales bacterium]|nr:hypothetical protein [Bacteroidales bacterium]